MVINELKSRIKKANYLEEDEKIHLLGKLSELSDEELLKLNDVFEEMEIQNEAIEQANDLAVAGVMHSLIQLNEEEFKQQQNG